MSPYTIVVIQPMSIGRGDGPAILSCIMRECKVSLDYIQEAHQCALTQAALHQVSLGTPSEFTLPASVGKTVIRRKIWICVFRSKLGNDDPTDRIRDYCGPEDMRKWSVDHLRYNYSAYKILGKQAFPEDTVVYISSPEKIDLITDLLLMNFKNME